MAHKMYSYLIKGPNQGASSSPAPFLSCQERFSGDRSEISELNRSDFCGPASKRACPARATKAAPWRGQQGADIGACGFWIEDHLMSPLFPASRAPASGAEPTKAKLMP